MWWGQGLPPPPLPQRTLRLAPTLLLPLLLLLAVASLPMPALGRQQQAAGSRAEVVRAANSEGSTGCARLLANGVFNTFSQSQSSTSKTVSQTDFQSAMCSTLVTISDVSTSTGRSGSFGVSFGGFGFSLGGSRSEAQQRLDAYRSNFCTSSSGGSFGSSLNQNSLNTLSKWVDPNLLSAYLECVKLDKQGLSIGYSVTRDAQAITITLGYFLQTGGGVVLRGLAVTGPATCTYLSPQLKPGFTLNSSNGKHSVQCTRRGPGVVTVTVATSAGATDFDMPDLLVPTAEARVVAQLRTEAAKLRQELAALRSELRAYTDAAANKLRGDLRAEIAAARSAVTGEWGGRVGPLEGRMAAVEGLTGRMSVDGGRDILNLNFARVRVNSLTAKTYMQNGFCEEGAPFPAWAYQCSGGYLRQGGCAASGAWDASCDYDTGGGAR